MNMRKHIGLIIGGVVSLILVILAVLLLLRFTNGYTQVYRKLNGQLTRLERLKGRDPFPSEANVEKARTNLAVLEDLFSELQQRLAEDQVEPVDVQAAAFPPMLERTVKRLRRKAEESGVTVPADFSFGFKRYLLGQLPQQEDISRLVIQLKTIERMCNMLFEAGITELEFIARDAFDERDEQKAEDQAQATRRRSRRRRVPKTKQESQSDALSREQQVTDLYSDEPFAVSFRANESAFWALMNTLDSASTFIVVSSMEISSDVPEIDLEKIAAARQKEAEESAGTARMAQLSEDFESRVVAGREHLSVNLDFEVYRFRDGMGEEAVQ